MSRRVIGSSALAGKAAISASAIEVTAIRDMTSPENLLSLVFCILGCFPSGAAAEHAADGHTDTGGVTLAQHIAGHDLAGCEHVGRWFTVFHQHARLSVHAGAEIGEGDAGPHR